MEFVNVCGCLVDYEELEKAILWYSDKPVTRLKKIYLHGSYPAVSVYDEKIHVHRLMVMYRLGNRSLPREKQVHHKDENKLNSLQGNLEVVNEGEHQSFHNKGRTLSKEHKEKIGLANRKRKGIKMKKRHGIPLNELRDFLREGKSVNWIAKNYGVGWSTIKNRIYENPELEEENK